MYRFSTGSKNNLATVKPLLQKVVNRAFGYQIIDITVSEGIRTIERQKEMVEKGLSQIMNSNHLTGNAIDLYPYVNGRLINDNKTEEDLRYWKTLALCMKCASYELGILIEWGGDWTDFIDMPHFELA